MTDSSEIGRFGTLRLLKRHDPNTTIAFFPVDDENITFGRSGKCSIRLYYALVSEVHCILRISEERKAFLVVKGANGVTIDGCEVTPSPTQKQDPIVPLTNGSEIEIHTKKFKFEYPPKEIRAALLATPRSSDTRRSLRMSMIASAQVLSPRKGGCSSPLKTPVQTPYRGLSLSRQVKEEEDEKESDDQWEVLKTPVKLHFPSEEREMLLIQGSGKDAVVVEEEKDLIILEHVDEPHEPNMAISPTRHTPTAKPPAPSSPHKLLRTPKTINSPSPAIPFSPVKLQPLKTPPPNRRKSGVSLHRAVVLRSAHRAYWEQARQRSLELAQDEEEEEEVELVVSPERDLGPFELCEDDEDDEVGKEIPHENNEKGKVKWEVSEDEEEEENLEDNRTQPSSSTSLPYSGPFETLRASLDMVKRLNFEKSPESVPLDVDEKVDSNKFKSPSPAQRKLNNFVTPQTVGFKSKFAQRVPLDGLKPRQTLSGGEKFPSLFGGARRVPVSAPTIMEENTSITVDSKDSFHQVQGATKPRITQQEREAILERRRSALLTPTTVLPPPGPRPSNVKPKVEGEDEYIPGKDDGEDSKTMLEKMKVKLENVQRKSESRKARLSYALLQTKGNSLDHRLMDQTSPSPAIKSRTLRMAEESLKQMKLEDDESETKLQIGTFSPKPSTFPQTPSFRGMKELFNSNRSWMAAPQTPSFVGLRGMFAIPTTTVTPDMKLDEVFPEVHELEDEDEDGEGEEVDHSDDLAMEIEECVDVRLSPRVLLEKPPSRLPTKRRNVRREISEQTSSDLDIRPQAAPTHFLKRATRRANVEPLIDVQNNHTGEVDHDGSTADQSGHADPVSIRRVTRSRNVKVAVEEGTKPAVPVAKRATRQTKKQQAEQTDGKSDKNRRGGQTAKQASVDIKREDEIVEPKSTQRRRTRVK